MLRALFLLLVLVNLAWFGWNWWFVEEAGEQTVAVESAPAGEPPLIPAPGVPALHLDEVDPAPRPAGRLGDWDCTQVGPFDDPAAARTFANLYLAPIQVYRVSQEARIIAWWVFVPAALVDDPQALAERLEAQDAGDFFIIRDGEHSGGLSFGLFSDRSRADRRAEEISALGVEARIQPRIEDVPRYWVWLRRPPDELRHRIESDREWHILPALCLD